MLPSFTSLTANLRQTGFDEIQAREFLGIDDIHEIGAKDCPRLVQRCLEDGIPLALAIALWLLHHSVGPKQLVQEMAGQEAFDWLIEQGFLAEWRPGSIIAQVDLSPCLGAYFFHDPRIPFSPIPDRVYELGSDSYWLARLTPRNRGAAALDLCTGSGVHAILAARHSDSVIAVDLNPKALHYAALNAHLNGLSAKCQFVHGDLYQPVGEQTFDLITINPPFVPAPDPSMQIHRWGGETGEDFSSRAIAGLPRHLRPRGTFAMVVAHPVLESSTFLERLSSWLGARAGWGILVLPMATSMSNEAFIAHQMADADPDPARTAQYLESYRGLGIVRIDCATVLIRRLEPDHPGFAVRAPLEHCYPDRDLSDVVEQCLQDLEARPQETALIMTGFVENLKTNPDASAAVR